MSNPQQNETEQFKRDINLLQDKLKQLKKQFITKWEKENRKNAKWTKANCKNEKWAK